MFRFVEWFDHADPVGKFGSANLKDGKIFSRYTMSIICRITPELNFFSFNIFSWVFNRFKKELAEVLWVLYFIVLGSNSDHIFSHIFNKYSYV